MLNNLAYWLAGRPNQALSVYETRAIFSLFFIIAYSFNGLPPNFFFSGVSEAGQDGSFLNQIFWITIFLFVVLSSQNIRKRSNSIFYTALPLLTLCLVLFVSSLWSLAPDITLRRAILQCIVIASVLLSINALQHSGQIFSIVYCVASFTLLFDFVMVFRANGFDESGLFRGIHPHKNVVGYIGAFSIITAVWLRRTGALQALHWNSLFLIGWTVLLVLSKSKTSLALTVIAPLFAIGLWRLSRSLKVSIGVLMVIMLCVAYCIFAIAFIAGFDVAGGVENWIHQIGFTGRDDIWQFLIARFLESPWLGHGYGGFWDIGQNSPSLRYGTGIIPTLNQAHNGYLDLLLGLGVLGVGAYLFVLMSFFYRLATAKRDHDRVLLLCWILFVFSLLHNLTESSILRGYALVWIFQVIALAITYRLAYESVKGE